MFDFGIPGYRPRWLTGLAAIRAEHGERLGALAGCRFTRSLLVWDHEAEEWFCDGPVVLDFDGEQVAINHQKFDELSITWNGIDPGSPIDWPVPGFDLRWRDDASAGLCAVTGRAPVAVELLTWAGGDLADDCVAVGFDFGVGGYLTVSNALDENALEFGPPDPRYRRHVLG